MTEKGEPPCGAAPEVPTSFANTYVFPPKNCHHPARRRNLVKNPIVFFHFQTNKHEFSNLTQHTNKKNTSCFHDLAPPVHPPALHMSVISILLHRTFKPPKILV